MRIQSVAIRNFRSCEDVRIELGPLTAIVGANGCGKSAALRALDLFYAPSPRVSVEDFYANDASRTISIEVTYNHLSPAELALFAAYVVGGTLSLVKEIRWGNGRASPKIHGSRLGNPAFASVRGQAATPARAAYAVLKNGDYPELPAATTLATVNQALDEWEAANPAKCSRILDDGAFFGFDNVGRGNLAKATRMLFVPAVRDAAADALDGKGSVISELVDVVVRREMAERPEFKALTEEVRVMHEGLLAGDGSSGVTSLGSRLTQTLKQYVPNASVDVRWEPAKVELPLPRAAVSVAEDGFMTSIAACGHGLQRAFIMSLLQELATAQSSAVAATPPGDTEELQSVHASLDADMLLVIEEPELFQHPSRQRHLASILARLADDAGARIQILYCTHSPHFVGVDRFDQVRLFRRVAAGGGSEPKVTKVSFTTLQSVAERIAAAKDEAGPVDGPSLRARLVPIMTPGTSEGFFADVAVLVEGDGDRAAVLAAAEVKGIDLEGSGVALIPCSGKSNVLTVSALLRELGIATYTIWDADAHQGPTEGNCETCLRPLDKKPNPKDNHDLMRLVGQASSDFPPLTVEASFACFHTDLEKTLEEEIGALLFNQSLNKVKSMYGMTKRNAAIKNPRVLAAVLNLAAEQGKTSPTLAAIVDRIVSLRDGGAMSDVAAPATA